MASDPPRAPLIPVGNLEPATLALFIREDFEAAWDAMATCNQRPGTGGNFMFARQALSFLELAARTASSWDTPAILNEFASRLAERDPRYFTELPGPVPLPAEDDFELPALAGDVLGTASSWPRSSTWDATASRISTSRSRRR